MAKCECCGRVLENKGHRLCRRCYARSKQEEIVYTRYGWKEVPHGCRAEKDDYLYYVKETLRRNVEVIFYNFIQKAIATAKDIRQDMILLPQVALSAIICKTGQPEKQWELNRVVDFLLVDQSFSPLVCIEINDKTHEEPERIKRDLFVKEACAAAGIPLVPLWVGVWRDAVKNKSEEAAEAEEIRYIQKELREALETRKNQARKPDIYRIYNADGDSILDIQRG